MVLLPSYQILFTEIIFGHFLFDIPIDMRMHGVTGLEHFISFHFVQFQVILTSFTIFEPHDCIMYHVCTALQKCILSAAAVWLYLLIGKMHWV